MVFKNLLKRWMKGNQRKPAVPPLCCTPSLLYPSVTPLKRLHYYQPPPRNDYLFILLSKVVMPAKTQPAKTGAAPVMEVKP